MKTICLVRHARAVRTAESPDIERHLEERGRQEARDVVSRVKTRLQPDLLVSSPAVRAMQTAELFAAELAYPQDQIKKRKALYDQTRNAFQGVIRELDERFSTAMLFGHNPSITEYARTLVSEYGEEIPAGGVVCVQFETDTWKDIKEGEGRVLFVEQPVKITRSGIQKRMRHELEERISAAVSDILSSDNRKAEEEVREDVARHCHKIAGKFLKRVRALEKPVEKRNSR